MPILECKQLSKSYGKAQALEGVSFAIEPGRIVGLLGPNGSGKTTLIKLANGLLTPTGGEILIDGKNPGQGDPRPRQLSAGAHGHPHMDERRAADGFLRGLLPGLPPSGGGGNAAPSGYSARSSASSR